MKKMIAAMVLALGVTVVPVPGTSAQAQAAAVKQQFVLGAYGTKQHAEL